MLMMALPLLAGCGGGGSSSGGGGGGGTTPLAHYTYSDLGSTDGGVNPTAINNSGQIIGELGDVRGTLAQPFRHSGSGPITHADNLGFYRTYTAGLSGLSAAAINSAGLVVGTANDPANQGNVAVIPYAYDTSFHRLGALPNSASSSSTVTGINDAGVIVGYTFLDGFLETHPFRHSGTGPITAADDLGVFGGYKTVQPAAISSSGLIVGTVDESSNLGLNPQPHAFVYDTTFHDLGPAGTFSMATAVNGSGQVVGTTFGLTFTHAFRHSGLGTLGPGDDLGVVPGFDGSLARAINASGVVVGRLSANSGDRAFVYSGTGPMRDLSDPALIPNLPGGMALQIANGINDQGQIVGYTNENGVAHGWLLTPIP